MSLGVLGSKAMPILSVHLSRDQLASLRRAARQHSVSVNRLVRRLIDGHADLHDPNRPSGVYEDLLSYALGRITQSCVCRRLRVDRWTLYELLHAAGLPQPRLAAKRTHAMAREFAEFLERHGIELGRPEDEQREV